MAFLLAFLTFAIVAMILLGLFLASGGGPQENTVRRRLEALDKGLRRGPDSLNLKLVRDELLSEVPAIHRFLMRWSWSTRLRDLVAQAGLKMRPGRLVLLSGVLAFGAFVLVQFLYRSFLLSLIAAGCGLLAPFAFVAIKRSRRLRAFEKGFPEAIDLLGRAVRAGHSFTTGLEMIATELPEPIAGEFRIVFDEQNFGLPLRDALLNLSERIPVIDVRFFVTALLIQKETGGNLAEILDNLSHVVRERFRILGEVRIRTAQGRLTAGILIALPPLMILMMRFLNPDYTNLLFSDSWGIYMLGTAAILQLIGSALLWKIVKIEV